MPRASALVLPFVILGAGAVAVADPPAKLPDTVQLPAGASVKDSLRWRYDDFDFVAAGGKTEKHAGQHWHQYLFTDGMGSDGKIVWQKWKAALAATGWVPVVDSETKPSLHLKKGATEAWLQLDLSGGEANLDLIQAAPPPVTLTLKEPAATPEVVDPKAGDFPFLAPFPQSQLATSAVENDPILVKLPGKDEPDAVGSGAIRKTYRVPEHLSNAEFQLVYGDALKRAGWTIVSQTRSSDATLTAHYAQHGRDLWAYLLSAPLDAYFIKVADLGDLGSTLAKDCHVALYGVFFDFNKATLKPESDPVLAKVAALLAKMPALQLEVQGHTDAVGDAAYNQTLSEGRAKAVVAWLTAHGTAATRLTAKGYGKTQPVADNGTPEGRAKNRRVEIANAQCKSK